MFAGEGQYSTSETSTSGNGGNGLEGSAPESWEDRDRL